MKTRVVPLIAVASLLASCVASSPMSRDSAGGGNGSGEKAAAGATAVNLTRAPDRVRVEIGGQLFTEYIFKDAPKPFLYPVLAADGTELTRNFPMKEVEGEVKDHPHHRSLWFTHGNVNGVDFWAESDLKKPGQTRQGTIVNDAVEHAVRGGAGEIRSRNRWVGPDGTVHCTDETTIRIQGLPDGSRYVDYAVTLKAPQDKPVTFGDTKEGSMAIRLPLWMTPSHRQGKREHVGQGRIVNANGIENDAAWGKKATWVDYHAPKGGKVYGVAMFDHPQNPRHPTWWHVRSYALFAANPFGKHDFENLKDQPKAGDLTIPAGQSVTFRWRFYIHYGDEKAAKVAERYQEFAAGK